MGIAAEMKDIAKDIANSYDLRVAEVGRLKREANEILAAFEASHQDRSAEVKAMRSGFQSSHKEMSSALKEDLADHNRMVKDEAAKLRQEIGASHQDRSAEVKAMRKGFQTTHKQMSSALKKDLAEHTQGVRGEVAKLRQEIGASHRDRSTEVKGMLNDFQRSHKQMGTQLRKELAHYDRGIKSEVAGMRQETKADLREARTAWQELASNMQVKRGGAEILPKAKAPVAKKEIPDLKAKLLAAIREHPQGITLKEVAESLGVAPVVFGRVSRKLLDEGKIRKEDKAYFPARAE